MKNKEFQRYGFVAETFVLGMQKKRGGGGVIGAPNYARALGFLRMLGMLGCLKTPTCLAIAY